MIEDRFSAIELVVTPLFMVLVARLCPSLSLVLVVLEGIRGPPGFGDCGSLVEPDLFNPLSGIVGFGGVGDADSGAAPVRAAKDCALAVSASASLSLESSRVCDLTDCVRPN